MIISWNTTNRCNLFCSHCYREAGQKNPNELSTAEAKKMIEEIARANFKIMIFSGGEPLMRDDIFELIAFAKKNRLRPVLGSNGTLITKETAQKLKDAGLAVAGISLDSVDEKKHDHLRGKNGAWQEAVRGMENCAEVGLPFQIHTTVMNWNADELDALTDFALEKKARGHHLFFLVPTGRATENDFYEKNALKNNFLYEEILKKILQRQKKLREQHLTFELKPTCAPQFMRLAKTMQIDMRFTRGCLAGLSYCIISPKGKVQPCAYLPIEAGDVHETPFDQIWKTSGVFEKLRQQNYSGSCEICGFKNCCGGCRARAFAHSGDMLAQDGFCILSRGDEQ